MAQANIVLNIALKAERVIHDLYGRFRYSGVRVIDSTDALPPEVQVHRLDEGGTTRLDNSFESLFFHGQPSSAPLSWPDLNLYEIEDAYLAGEDGNIFLQDSHHLRICSSLRSQPRRKLRLPLPPLAHQVDEPTFPLIGRNHENRGHFLLHHVPRYLAAEQWLQTHAPDTRILLHEKHASWQSQYLERLGINTGRVITSGSGTIRASRLLYTPQPWSSHALGNPRWYRTMRNRFAKKANTASDRLNPVWISRDDAPDRRLLNEEQLIEAVIEAFGSCRRVVLSQTPLDEQIRIFASTQLIFGGLGQGFANLLFADHTTCIILDTIPDWDERWFSEGFRDLANLLNGRGTRFFSGLHHSNGGDWEFPTETFKNLLGKLSSLLSEETK